MNNRKGYKAFKKGLICAPDENHVKQYEENTTYEEEGGKICGAGMMHYCVRPLDVLSYYNPVDNNGMDFTEFAEVEALDEPVTDDNQKFATKKLHIGAKISFANLVEASIKYDLEKCNVEGIKTGFRSGNSQTGFRSGNSQTGDYSGNSQTGDCSGNSQTGFRSGNSQTGFRSGNSQTGFRSGNSQTGDYSGNSQTGACSESKQTGKYSASLSTGIECKHNAAGEKCIAVCWGADSVAKGAIGSYLVLSEWEDGEMIDAKMTIIDGERIKADTWYKLENGEFVEVER